MPSINMIAARRAEKKAIERRVRMALLSVLIVIGLGLGLMSVMTAKIYRAGRDIENFDQLLVKIQPTVDRIGECEREISELGPRLDLLSESRDRTLLWCTILHDLSRSMPERTWLANLVTQTGGPGSGEQGAEPPSILNVKGTAVSQMLVGEVMLRMNKFPEFEKLDLTFTQQGAEMAENTVDFQIAATLKSVSKKPAKAEGGKDEAPGS